MRTGTPARVSRQGLLAFLLICALAAVGPAVCGAAPAAAPVVSTVQAEADGGKPTPAELEMGKQAAEQIEKEFKVVDDPAALERISQIVQRLRPHTQRPAVEYQCRVLDGTGVGINAFALPGGYLYISRPLLEAVESDDELAAVIAHEMAHVCLRHGLDLVRREAKANQKIAIAVMATVMAGGNVDPGDIALVATLYKTGLLSGYSRKAESEADANAVVYLQAAGYYPIAVLTVVQGLARMELTRPHVELGIFRTHPYPEERARATIRQLTRMGIDLNPRPVLETLKTKAETVERDGRTIGRVSLDQYVVFEAAAEADGLSPQQRAEKIAADLRRLILANLHMHELQVASQGCRALVLARGEPIMTVVPGDAEFHHSTVGELAEKAAAAIKLALWEEAVRRAY